VLTALWVGPLVCHSTGLLRNRSYAQWVTLWFYHPETKLLLIFRISVLNSLLYPNNFSLFRFRLVGQNEKKPKKKSSTVTRGVLGSLQVIVYNWNYTAICCEIRVQFQFVRVQLKRQANCQNRNTANSTTILCQFLWQS